MRAEAVLAGAVAGLLMIALIVAWLRQPRARNSVQRWNAVVPGVRVSTSGAYQLLTRRIKARRIPGVKVKQVSLFEANPFSFRRRYLRVRRGNFVVYILCAAIDRRDVLIAYWVLAPRSLILTVLSHTPGLRWLAKAIRAWRSFDVLPRGDADTYFRDVIHRTVAQLAEELNPGNATTDARSSRPRGARGRR